jgi:cation:H+ antiporter
MDIVWAIVLLAAGVLMLARSADLLVGAAVCLARHFGISPLVVGLTVVAVGTSAPEAAAGIAAALRGAGDVAIGNVYGSNIANLALIGGLCAVIRPIETRHPTARGELVLMLVAALLLLPLLWNNRLGPFEAAVLLASFAACMALVVVRARRARQEIPDTRPPARISKGPGRDLAVIAASLAGLALGAEAAVRGAITLGETIGLSEAVIGLTIVAIGTSLPELATSAAAALRGQSALSAGNLVGSNIFNALLVPGFAGLLVHFIKDKDITVTGRLAGGPDYWVMMAVSLAFALLVWLSGGIGRRAGAALAEPLRGLGDSGWAAVRRSQGPGLTRTLALWAGGRSRACGRAAPLRGLMAHGVGVGCPPGRTTPSPLCAGP